MQVAIRLFPRNTSPDGAGPCEVRSDNGMPGLICDVTFDDTLSTFTSGATEGAGAGLAAQRVLL